MVIDKDKLKLYAELLEAELNACADKSEDVKFLLNYEPLMRDIDDAKKGLVTSPRWDHGLGRWWAEDSTIDDYYNLSDKLSAFRLLLRGKKLSGGD